MAFIPDTKAIINLPITYRCNLVCEGCNILGFLPHSIPDMTPEDVQEFFRQAG